MPARRRQLTTGTSGARDDRCVAGRARRDPAAGLGDLEAALTREDCPVCVRAEGADERWLDRFLDDGYLERDLMRRIAAGGGFCAYHAGRIAATGQSATVALIYLGLIADCLPRLAALRNAPWETAGAGPFRCSPRRNRARPARISAKSSVASAFFSRCCSGRAARDCYGAPALVCLRHLPPLLGYLDEPRIGDILARHRDAAPRLTRAGLIRPIRVLLGPPPAVSPPAPRRPGPAPDRPTRSAPISPIPVSRMRRRLRDLPSCAICAEIADARAEWLGWLAGASEKPARYRMCCRYAAITSGRRAASPARHLRRRSPQSCGARPSSVSSSPPTRRWPVGDRVACSIGWRARSVPPGLDRARRAALDSLGHGRECPFCARVREAGERALSLVAALVENADGRRAFESGYGLCVRHAARAMAMPDAPPFARSSARTTRARLALLRWELEEQMRRGAWQARPTTARRRIGRMAAGRPALRRHRSGRQRPGSSVTDRACHCGLAALRRPGASARQIPCHQGKARLHCGKRHGSC